MDGTCGIKDPRADKDLKRACSALSCKDFDKASNPTTPLRGFPPLWVTRTVSYVDERQCLAWYDLLLFVRVPRSTRGKCTMKSTVMEEDIYEDIFLIGIYCSQSVYERLNCVQNASLKSVGISGEMCRRGFSTICHKICHTSRTSRAVVVSAVSVYSTLLEVSNKP